MDITEAAFTHPPERIHPVRSDRKYIRSPLSKYLAYSNDDTYNNISYVLDSLMNFLPEGAFIAGGFLTSLITGAPVNDLDIFFRNTNAFNATLDLFTGKLGIGEVDNRVEFFKTYKRVADGPTKTSDYLDDGTRVNVANILNFESSDTAYPKVQLIRIDYVPDIESVIDRFDFSACQFGLETDPNWDWILVHGETSIEDAKSKTIKVINLEPPERSKKRINKYIEKGYFVPVDVMETLNKHWAVPEGEPSLNATRDEWKSYDSGKL